MLACGDLVAIFQGLRLRIIYKVHLPHYICVFHGVGVARVLCILHIIYIDHAFVVINLVDRLLFLPGVESVHFSNRAGSMLRDHPSTIIIW